MLSYSLRNAAPTLVVNFNRHLYYRHLYYSFRHQGAIEQSKCRLKRAIAKTQLSRQHHQTLPPNCEKQNEQWTAKKD